MTRFALLAAVAFGLAVAPASAQMDPVDAPADSVAIDSVAVPAPDPDLARTVYAEGLELYRAGSHQEALLKYEEALVAYDAFAPAGIGRAQALAQLGRLEDSRTAFEAAVAMAEASDASNAAQFVTAARRGLDQVTAALDAAAAANAERSQQAAAQESGAAKLASARSILASAEVSEAQGAEAVTLLDQSREEAGYTEDALALDYAKALTAAGRASEAIPYAESALAASEGQADRSAFYIQLGLTQMAAGNADDARAAFESITEGQSWHGWAQHYLRELDGGAEG